jgi:hypothetical protein
MALNPGNVGAFLRRKSDYGLPNQRANVFLDGKPAGTWYSSGSFSGTDTNGVPRRWRDEEFPLPASLTEGKSSVNVQLQFARTTTDKAWSDFDYQMYSFVPAGCTRTLPAGNVGSPYSALLAATGGTPPYTWSISAGALPAGLNLNPASGAISGSPTGPPGTASFTATATDHSTSPQSTAQPMSVAVSPPLPTSCTTFSSSASGSHQVCGAILAKYQSLGGPTGFLGLPTTDETGTPDGIGRFNHFANGGSIYWTPTTGAWSIHGAIRVKWASLGWERSFLGYPVTDETGAPGGTGRFNHFSSSHDPGDVDGSIYWTPAVGTWSIHGAIRSKYLVLGGPASILGYPVTDETGTPDGIGRFNHFTSTDSPSNTDGSIYWTAGTGAWSVHGAIRSKWASLGWERSCLGYPLSDEFAISGGRQSNFQHGVITYSFGSGQATYGCG